MKYPAFLFVVALACIQPGQVSAGPVVISRDGWSYDRAGFRYPAERVAEIKEEGKGLKLPGWVEYDVTVPASGWYELWLGGSPAEWPRDVSVDGKIITRLQISEGADKLTKAPKQGVQFKEVNLFLTEGRHALRIQRLGFPGVLPSIWELRAVEGQAAGGSVRVSAVSSRIVAPGAKVTVTLLGGTTQATRYDLFLRDERTEATTPVGQVEFPASPQAVEKTLTITLPDEGLYTLQARVGEEWLRPSDLKAGYFLAAGSAESRADAAKDTAFQIAGIFANGVVLQQGKLLPVWGWSAPGETITVTLAGQVETTRADAKGAWRITFKPLKAGVGALELKAVSTGGKTITFTDVQVGEVWLLSGQSNMGGGLASAPGGNELGVKNDYPHLRLADLFERTTATGEKRLPQVSWSPAVFGGDATKFKKWRAIHYAFGSDLSRELKIPVGLIAGNRGGTYLSTWTSRETHQKDPSFKVMLDGYDRDEAERVLELVHLNKLAGDVRKWREASAKAAAEGKPAPKALELRADISEANAVAKSYDALIAPLAPFPIRGVLWYQGESDGNMAAAYAKRFPVMIQSWRELWNDPQMPFIFVQIAYGRGERYTGQPEENSGSELKDVQRRTLAVPNTAMVVTNDLMTPNDGVHYADKLPVGHRLALTALATVYGKQVEYSGPLYRSHTIEGGKIRLKFDHADGLSTKDGAPLGGFAIAGKDRKWVWADAVMDGDTVVAGSPQVPEPVAVRYSWAASPSGGNLVNKAGLPSPVFRTDDWPMSTDGVEWDQKN